MNKFPLPPVPQGNQFKQPGDYFPQASLYADKNTQMSTHIGGTSFPRRKEGKEGEREGKREGEEEGGRGGGRERRREGEEEGGREGGRYVIGMIQQFTF
jgi:hypothetical protein